MSAKNSSSSFETSLLGLTFLVFLVLKLCKVIDWSWWWITAPLWGGVAIALLLILISTLCFGFGYYFKKKK